jgi:hypothetical protein
MKKKKKQAPPFDHFITKKRHERVRQVQDLHDQGWTDAEIAELFGKTERMIRYDLRDGKAFDIAISKSVDQGEVLGKEIRSYEQALRSEWRNYHLNTNPLMKVAFMRNIISLKEKYVKFLQSAGLLDKVPEQINLGKAPPNLSDFTKEELELVVSIGIKLGGGDEEDYFPPEGE